MVSFDELVARQGVSQVLRQLEIEKVVNFDHIARVLAHATERHAGTVALRFANRVTFIGRHNFNKSSISQVLPAPEKKGGIFEVDNVPALFPRGGNISELPVGIKAIAGAFIWVKNEVIGTVGVLDQGLSRPLTERQKMLLTDVADYIALQVERRARIATVAYNLQSESVSL